MRLGKSALAAAALVVALALAAPAAAVQVHPLPTGTDVDYQLGGATRVPDHVGIVARDRLEQPAPGLYNICYVNGFQAQTNERGFWRRHLRLILQEHGHPVVDEGWDEWLLDVGTASRRRDLASIVGGWTARCARDGFDAVEFDNLDSYTRSRQLLTRADNLAFARLLVRAAHRSGLAAGQKNLAGLDGTRLGFDFAVAEECARYHECAAYDRHYGQQVVMIEYRLADFRRGCRGYGDTHAIVLRDRDLAPGFAGRRWC